MEPIVRWLEGCYRDKKVDATEQELRNIASLQLELAAVDIIEIYSPQRFTTGALKLGLRPGSAVDLSEAKPSGPNRGEFWDLRKQEDIDELDALVDHEEPTLLTGSPTCEAFSQLLRL